MPDEWTEADDVIEEVREIRRQISARFDDDPTKLLAHIMELEKSHKGPFIEFPDGEARGKSAA